MESSNLLRLTDEDDDPVTELRRGAAAVRRATRRILGRALDTSLIGEVASGLWRSGPRVSEDALGIVVKIELPRVDPKSIETTLNSGNVLRVRWTSRGVAKKRFGKRSTLRGPWSTRGDRRTFERWVFLGHDVDRRKAVATLEGDVLEIAVPRWQAEVAVPKSDVRAA